MSIAEKFVTMEYGPAPEDPKEAQAWLQRHGHRFGHFINGAWQIPVIGEYFDTLDPSNGDCFGFRSGRGPLFMPRARYSHVSLKGH